jgi:hypothetical protein
MPGSLMSMLWQPPMAHLRYDGTTLPPMLSVFFDKDKDIQNIIITNLFKVNKSTTDGSYDV